MSTDMDDLLAWRKEFPILEKSVYMISNSLGAMPRAVYESLQEYAETWATRGVCAWDEGWWEMPVEIGDLIGKIIGAAPGEVSMHQNVTIAQAIVFSSLPISSRRNKIVYSQLNFPSVRYFYQAQQQVKIEVVPCPDGITVPLEEMLLAIDELTLVVPISHVIFKSSFIQDAAAIIEKAHSVGALVILDTYQSCGAVPFNVKELDVDFVIGGSIKWLCGGPGTAYLYVRPELRDQLQPQLTGWMAHEHPFEFAPEMEYARSAFRFLNGTPNIPGLYAARCGYEIIAAAGVERIRRKSLQMTERILELADDYGFQVNTPRRPDQRGGHATINPPDAQQVCRELIRRNFIVDYRPGAGIRVAPHFYNTMDEVEEFMAAMKSIAYAGAGR
jgi:kynureninase